MNKLFVPFLPPWVETGLQPAFYDKESGTVLQQTARMYDKVNQLIRNFNELSEETKTTVEEYILQFNDLKDFVDDYFDNLDVQEEINNKLDAMVEDGTLSSIIGAYINDGFLNDNFYIYPIRKGRHLAKNSADPTFDSSTDHGGMQGGCYISNDRFIQAYNMTSPYVELQEIDLASGSIVRSSVLQLQHANSIAYVPSTNMLYITSLTANSANTAYIYVVDYSTFIIGRTIDLTSVLQENEGTHSISYDVATGKMILATEMKTTNYLRFFDLDLTDDSITEIPLNDKYKLISNGGGRGSNDICVYDNHLYLLKQNPNSISEWDITTGDLIKVYNIPMITCEGYTQGEVESISYSASEKIFYISSYAPDCNGGFYYINSFYTVDLIHNEPIDTPHTKQSKIHKKVYVDIDSTAFNPNGSSGSPFATIGEALNEANKDYVGSLEIELTNDKTYPYVTIYTNKTLIISVNDTSTRDTIVNGIAVRYCTNVFITSLVLNSVGSHENDLNVLRSNIEITSCTLNEATGEHIELNHSAIKFYNLTTTNILAIKSTGENNIDCLDNAPSYNVTNKMPAINKPVQVTTFTNITTTAQEKTVSNIDLVNLSNNVQYFVNGLYFNFYGTILTQHSDGGNRNFSAVIGDVVASYQVVFDYTNNKISCKLRKAYNYVNGEDVTATTTGTSIQLFVES